MGNNTNLNIRNVNLEVQARVVTTTHDIASIVVLAHVVVAQASDAHSSCYAHLWKDIYSQAWVHIELRSEVTAERGVHSLATRCEA